MKLILISDTHNRHRELEIPEGDILLHAGDITLCGELKVLADFNAWLGELKQVRHKVCIAGNHDRTLTNYGFAQTLLNNASYLQDELIEIEDLKIYGSPWTPEYGNWAFMTPRLEMVKHWERLLSGRRPDILLTHGPPYGILDQVDSGRMVGCEQLFKAVQKCQPDLHIFGHIHEARGSLEQHGTKFHNVATLDSRYHEVRQPIVIDYEKSQN